MCVHTHRREEVQPLDAAARRGRARASARNGRLGTLSPESLPTGRPLPVIELIDAPTPQIFA